jgi:hypothetical protein
MIFILGPFIAEIRCAPLARAMVQSPIESHAVRGFTVAAPELDDICTTIRLVLETCAPLLSKVSMTTLNL